LTGLLRKEAQFKWENRQQFAFDQFKEVLCWDQILAHPDFNAPFILTADASKVAVAAVLSQV
jgi:hypothetical protein